MRKIIFALICALVLTCFAACSGGGNTADNSTPLSSAERSVSDGSDESEAPSASRGESAESSQGQSLNQTSSAAGKPSASEKESLTASNGTTGGDYPQESAGDIYVSTAGSDANDGSADSPLYSLSAAVAKIGAGSVVYLMPGRYNYDSRIVLAKSGTADAPITVQAYEWGEVILDFTNQPYGFNDASYAGILISGNYWKIQGLTICHAGDNGIKIEGSHNYVGRCVLHHNGDTGIQLGFGHNSNNPNGELCAYNTVENCDSYLNYDFDNHGDADGFACKMHNGKGNVFISCRAWRNCDDGWDLYETDWAVEIINCWAWESGNDEDFINDEYFSDAEYLAKKSALKKVSRPTQAGNGNGIKLGGNGSKGQHVVRNCIVFGNDITGSVKGFDENSHEDGVIVENCVSWDNGYNFMFENSSGNKIFRNNLSFYTGTGTQKPNRAVGELFGNAIIENNNFDRNAKNTLIMTLEVTADDFISISEKDALAPRGADGSLPNNGFGRLKETSEAYKLGMGIR